MKPAANKYIFTITLTLLVYVGFGQSNKVRRLNLGADSSLPDILVSCISMKNMSDTTYFEYGLTCRYKRIVIESKLEVQTECNGTTEAKWETATAKYEIAIPYDSNEILGRRLIDSSYRDMKGKKALFDCFPGCSWNKYLLYQDGQYVFYHYPGNNWVNSYYTLYFSDYFVKVTFKGFIKESGWGGLSSFFDKLCYFSWGSTVIQPGAGPNLSPRDFIILYENGRFKN